MYYSNITNPELNYFKGLTVPNFTIKLSDILHKTNGEYDNKLFQIEQITTTIYRIVPMFYCEEINGTNPNDNILDDQCIIAHKEETETWFTFIGEPNNHDIQDYQNYASYYEIGDSLTMNEFNSIVSLLKHHITHNDRIRLNETVQGLYGTYEFDIEDCSFLDTGILITDETLTAEPKVRLTDNVFRWSTYTLKLTVFHFTGVNILDDIDPSDLKVVDTIEVELVFNEWVDIPIESLEENYIISFDAIVEINHDKPEIHILSGIDLYADTTVVQKNQSTEVYAQLLDLDGREYDINDASGRTVHFYEVLEPTLTVTATPSVFQTGETSEIYANVVDEDGSKAKGVMVHFYEAIEEAGPSLSLVSDKDILSYADSETATLIATYEEDGEPVTGETVTMEVYDSTQTTLLDTLTVTDEGDGTYTATYTSAGVGDVVVVCECGLLQETYTIEDCWYANDGSSVGSLEVGSNVSCTSNGEYITITTSTSGEKDVKIPVALSGDWEFETTLAENMPSGSQLTFKIGTGQQWGAFNPSNTATVNLGSSQNFNKTVQKGMVLKITYINGVMTVYWNNEQLTYKSLTLGSGVKMGYYTNSGRYQYIKDIKLKLL